MSDSEVFSNYIKKNSAELSRSAEVSLITLERAQKLDLLIHLISNLRQSLVVCGPKGIGKTTLLNELSNRKKDSWPMTIIAAAARLSFEGIEEQLVRFLRQTYVEYQHESLSSILALLDEQGQKVIVVIEDAGLLVPGLVTTLIQYASTSESLKVILVLTNDELHIKSTSDKIIDDCHFIEMPPLTEIQCGVFLQNMSSQPKAAVSFNAISDKMVAQLYRKTHGIPGKIMMELPNLSNYSTVTGSRWKWGAILSVLLLIGVSYFVLNTENEAQQQERELLTKPLVLGTSKDEDILLPVIEREEQEAIVTSTNKQFNETEFNHSDTKFVKDEQNAIISSLNTEKKDIELITEKQKNEEPAALVFDTGISSKKHTEDSINIELAPKIKSKPPIENKIKIIPVINKTGLIKEQHNIIPINKKPVAEILVKNTIDDRQWLLAQAEKSYTIQLMVLSQKQAVKDFLRKNPKLQQKLKYFKVSKQGKTKYVLVYGSYKNAKLAAEEMKSLPVRYRKSWVRRFKELQKDIK